ncbi:hypothetical protein FA15DRAFT_758274 [Coprinopsis marcescibilis]|uniref:Uncharacterized protein n=1 Tax=Coprinopsis marcescibilis TaxID=230819 RepID=A0A5C3KPA2_COPMA|nr:hypothetical protein FA15DRAFT_758274 [Coprinopsis marcescibilis]
MDDIEEISTLAIALDNTNTNTALPQSDEIKRLRGAMHRERAMLSALKSPIREVPSEIVAIIIELALFSDRGMLDADGRRTSAASVRCQDSGERPRLRRETCGHD